MAMNLSKTQIDKLGERLKKGDITEDDLRFLDAYRRSFGEAYEFVVGAIRKELRLELTGRPAKSTTSISDKLRRESIRLTQIQDIAGCRLIVLNIDEQERVVQSLSRLFEGATIIDRRQKSSHGYRAVHAIVKSQGKMVEIQIRTSLQHNWAELSEKYSDVSDPAIKYGGGDEKTQKTLAALSSAIASVEAVSLRIALFERSRGSIEH
jgi:ppGpp synthetase/RelA/SpoT-type nucleotidyltranferase